MEVVPARKSASSWARVWLFFGSSGFFGVLDQFFKILGEWIRLVALKGVGIAGADVGLFFSGRMSAARWRAYSFESNPRIGSAGGKSASP
jgi:hypothetical protein